MKIAICWDWDNEISQLITWEDGFAAMFKELGKMAEVKVFTQLKRIDGDMTLPHPYFPIHCSKDHYDMEKAVHGWKPDFVLFWADMTRPAIPNLCATYPSGILFSGGEPITPWTHKFDVIFTESADYLEIFKSHGLNAHQAFGTNTTLFKPKKQPKIFDSFFPATFAEWKRHNLFAEATRGLKSYACGWKQQFDIKSYEVCEKNGVFTTNHMTSHVLADVYNASKTVLVTSADNGGSQRTVLEAMACNVPCIVMSDSKKTSEYLINAGYSGLVSEPNVQAIREKINEWSDKEVNTREWVVNSMSEFTWSKKVYEEICHILK